MAESIWENGIVRVSAVIAAAVAICGTIWATTDYLEVRPVILKEFRVARSEIDQREDGDKQILLAAQTKLQQVTDDNSKAILLIQFQLLIEKKKHQQLSFEEQQQLCRLAAALEYVGVPGCS